MLLRRGQRRPGDGKLTRQARAVSSKPTTQTCSSRTSFSTMPATNPPLNGSPSHFHLQAHPSAWVTSSIIHKVYNVHNLLWLQETPGACRAYLAWRFCSVLLTWGDGSFGQIGQGRNKKSSQPFAIPRSSFDIGSEPLQFTRVSCGEAHTLCVLSNGAVYSFGDGERGQLGLPVGRGPSEPSVANKPSPISALASQHIVDISAGKYHSVFLTRTILVCIKRT